MKNKNPLNNNNNNNKMELLQIKAIISTVAVVRH
jgi:hypothetical protein